MSDEEIISLWYNGITRLKLAKIYQRRYNQKIEIIRFDMKNRHVRFISYKEALNKVEKILMREVRK